MALDEEENPNANRPIYKGPWGADELAPSVRARREKTAKDPDLNPVIHKRSFPLERYQVWDVKTVLLFILTTQLLFQGINLGNWRDFVPWPEDLPKGKNFLINDTYIRIDGVDWFNVKSNVGKYKPIEIHTGVKYRNLLPTPVCEGYVFAPNARRFIESSTAPHLMYRCMRGEELEAAKKDAIFLKESYSFYQYPERSIWAEYRHSTNDFGETDGNLKLQAFNRALHKKRVAENLKRHAAGKKYDYEDLMNSTYDPKKHTLKIDPEALKDMKY